MMGSLFRIRFLGLTMAVLLLFACSGDGGNGGAASHRRAPGFALKDLQGGILRLEDFRGKVVLLNFFATWCAPCRQEVPEFIQLRKKFRDKGLEIVGISLDMEGATVLKPFVRHFRIPYPIVIGTRDVVSDYGGIEGVPTTFFVDRQGFIVKRVIGLVPRQSLEQAVESLL